MQHCRQYLLIQTDMHIRNIIQLPEFLRALLLPMLSPSRAYGKGGRVGVGITGVGVG